MPLRRLTRSQYNNAVRDLFDVTSNPADAFPPDELVGPFPANATQAVSRSHVQRIVAAADAVSNELTADAVRLATLLGCAPSESCVQTYIERVAPRAFRRPIAPEQLAALMGVYRAGAAFGPENGVRLVIQAILNAPDFLYLVENKPAAAGAEPALLDPFELAARLAFFLWDTLPDEALVSKAQDGSLQEVEVLRREAERMLADTRASQAIANFTQYWLGFSQVEKIGRSQKDNIHAVPELPAAMKRESLRFADFVIREGDGSMKTLLTAPFSFLDTPLYPVYGISTSSAGAAEQPVGLPVTQRAGILTQPAFLAAHSHADHTSPVKRGVYVLNNVLCSTVPTPEGLAIPELPDPDPEQSTRERFAQHTREPACAGCHTRIDPLGFALERFDAIGMWRDEEKPGVPIVDAATVAGVDPSIDGDVSGGVALVHRLASSPVTASCMVRQWYRFALARPETDADTCSLAALERAFAESNRNIRDLILELVAADAFRYRPANP